MAVAAKLLSRTVCSPFAESRVLDAPASSWGVQDLLGRLAGEMFGVAVARTWACFASIQQAPAFIAVLAFGYVVPNRCENKRRVVAVAVAALLLLVTGEAIPAEPRMLDAAAAAGRVEELFRRVAGHVRVGRAARVLHVLVVAPAGAGAGLPVALRAAAHVVVRADCVSVCGVRPANSVGAAVAARDGLEAAGAEAADPIVLHAGCWRRRRRLRLRVHGAGFPDVHFQSLVLVVAGAAPRDCEERRDRKQRPKP